ncbi:hypothetical protein BH09PSE6_BH09PSE6_22710 [soil metagenome]
MSYSTREPQPSIQGLTVVAAPLASGSTRRIVALLIAACVALIVAEPAVAALPAIAPGAWLLLLAGGLLSGFLAGFLGIGGALVTVPTLYAALPGLGVGSEQLPQVVVATALVVMVPTTVAAAWSQHLKGTLDRAWLWRLAPLMAAGAVAGALLASELRGPVLGVMFALQGIYYGVRLISVEPSLDGPRGLSRYAARLPAGVAGPAMSAFCACVGMGGGSMVAPWLMSRGVALRPAVATASALNLSIAFGGTLAFVALSSSHASAAHAHWLAALVIGGLSVLVVPFGVATAHRLRLTSFRLAVGAVNVIGASSLLVQALWH